MTTRERARFPAMERTDSAEKVVDTINARLPRLADHVAALQDSEVPRVVYRGGGYRALQQKIDKTPEGGLLWLDSCDALTAGVTIDHRIVVESNLPPFSQNGPQRFSYTGGTGAAFTLTADGIVLRGFGVNNAGTGTIGVQLTGTNVCVLDGLSVQNFTADLILLNDGTQTTGIGGHTVRRCLLQGNAAGGGNAIRGLKVIDWLTVEQNHFLWGSGSSNHGLVVDGTTVTCTGGRVIGNLFEATPSGATNVFLKTGCYGWTSARNRVEMAGGRHIRQDSGAIGLHVQEHTVASSGASPSAVLCSFAGAGGFIGHMTMANATVGLQFEASCTNTRYATPNDLGTTVTTDVNDLSAGGATLF